MINSRPEVNSATFTYGDGDAYLQTDGHACAISIRFKGNLKAVCHKMPQNTYCIRKNNTILFTKRNIDKKFPDHLFLYHGSFRVLSVKVYSNSKNYKVADIVYNPIKDIWNDGESSEGTFDSQDILWNEKDKNLSKYKIFVDARLPKVRGSVVVVGNQYTSGGKFYNSDGSNYIGYYNRTDKNEIRSNRFVYDKEMVSAKYESDLDSNYLFVKRSNRLGMFEGSKVSTSGWVKTTKALKVKSARLKEQMPISIEKSKTSASAIKNKLKHNKSESYPTAKGPGHGAENGYGVDDAGR